MKEYILCSAIHIDDGKDYEDVPAGIFTGFVVTGRRHSDCYQTIKNLCKILCISSRYRDIEDICDRKHQGFLTSKDRYVSREEAYIIAKRNNQLLLPPAKNDEGSILTSEELYYP